MRMKESFLVVALGAFFSVFAQEGDLWSNLEQELAPSSSPAVVIDTVAPETRPADTATVDSLVSSSSQAVVIDTVAPETRPADTATVDSLVSSSSQVVVFDSATLDTAQADSVLLSSSSSTPLVAPAPLVLMSSSSLPVSSSSTSSSSSFSPRDLLGPVKVSRVNAIDGMKGKYRSPRRALFMSLVVPGSGQLYVGGSTMNYVRGAGYLAVEAALISGWYYYTVYKYDQQVRKYKSFARDHYSVGDYETRIHDLWNQLDDATQESNFQKLYGGVRLDYCSSIYGNSALNGCYANDTTFVKDAAHVAYVDSKSLTELNPYDSEGLFYSISNEAFVLGWSDVTDIRTVAELDLADETDYSYVPLGSSEHLATYRSLRRRANDLADMQAWFFGGLLINHIVSAIDATLAARTHNLSLYEEKLTFLDKMRLDSRVGMQNGFAATVRAVWGF